MPVDPRLVETVRCPVTLAPIELLSRERVDRLNALIGKGRVQHVDGSPVTRPMQAGFVTKDGARVYPVQEGILVMRAEAAIGTDGLEGF